MKTVSGFVECLAFDLGRGKTSVSVTVDASGFDHAILCGRVNAYTWTATSSIYWRLILEDKKGSAASYTRFDDDLVKILEAPSGTTFADGHIRNDGLLRSGALTSDFTFTLRLTLANPEVRFIFSPNGAVNNTELGAVLFGLDPTYSRS